MTILDRRDTSSLRVDVSKFAEELARRLPALDDLAIRVPAAGDVEPVAAVTEGAHESVAAARERLDRATEVAREISRDLARAGTDLHLEARLDDVAQRIRAASAGMPTFAQIVARLERELPTTDRDRYDRAYLRGRVQARSRYIVVGVVVGITTGVVAAILLDPARGRERREQIGRRASDLTSTVTKRASEGARVAGERARALAAERGIGKAGVASSTVTEDVAAGEPSAGVPVMAPPDDPAATLGEPRSEPVGEPASVGVVADTAAASRAERSEQDPAVTPSSHG